MDKIFISQFLTLKDVRRLKKQLDFNNFELNCKDNLTFNRNTQREEINTKIRSSQFILYKDLKTLEWVDKNIICKLKEEHLSNGVYNFFYADGLSLIRYGEGDFFEQHVDMDHSSTPTSIFYTFLICIMGCSSGGSTTLYFPDEENSITYPTGTSRGSFLAFDKRIPHKAEVVNNGQKYILKGTIHYSNLREDDVNGTDDFSCFEHLYLGEIPDYPNNYADVGPPPDDRPLFSDEEEESDLEITIFD